jgi:hypothetical protein
MYQISYNKKVYTFRIHLSECNIVHLHENKKGNQIHEYNLTLQEAEEKLKNCTYTNKNYCGTCLSEKHKEYKKEQISV